jgi:hypothetical protein
VPWMPPPPSATSALSSTAGLARLSWKREEHVRALSCAIALPHLRLSYLITYGDDLQIFTPRTPRRDNFSPRSPSLLVGRWLGHPTAAPAPASLASHALQCLSPAIVSASVLSARRQSLSYHCSLAPPPLQLSPVLRIAASTRRPTVPTTSLAAANHPSRLAAANTPPQHHQLAHAPPPIWHASRGCVDPPTVLRSRAWLVHQ